MNHDHTTHPKMSPAFLRSKKLHIGVEQAQRLAERPFAEALLLLLQQTIQDASHSVRGAGPPAVQCQQNVILPEDVLFLKHRRHTLAKVPLVQWRGVPP